MTTNNPLFQALKRKKDLRWLLAYSAALVFVGVWGLLFLNLPSLKKVVEGFFNTLFIAFVVSGVSLVLGWLFALALHFLEIKRKRSAYLVITFLMNLLRSVPQVVGVLFSYVLIAQGIQGRLFESNFIIFPLMSVCMSLFIFVEITDLMRERIAHFMRLDFYNAMRVCGVPEGRIVNFDILWKNSRIHILNKLISVFGMAVFLQCSADFIISVGLSADVNAVNLPVTLGSLLATLDSKQDILAIGYTLTHPSYFYKLFFTHLQGVTVAFLIVFSLLSIDRIAGGYAERHRL
jgi:ABC-type dipeptide/oligopeptide/nickel transport system permease subunit